MIFEELFSCFTSLADALAIERVPGAAFLDDADLTAEIDDLAVARNAGAVKNIKFRFLERRRHFVFDYFDAGAPADDIVAVFERADAADVHAHGRVKLERVAAGGGFRIAEHDADLHADLVDKNHHGVGPRNGAGQFAQSLRHQPRLQAHVRIAHLAFDFRLRHQGRYRVDDQDIDGAAANESLADFQRLFTMVRLRDQEVVCLNTKLLRVA